MPRPPTRRTHAVASGYRRILVPVVDNAESEHAVDVACRLAADEHASITAVSVVEVPALLPLDAHMLDEEQDARRVLHRADAIASSYGVDITTRILRARDAASAVVGEAIAAAAEIVVLGGARRTRHGGHGPVFGRTLQDILKKSPCRVMIVAATTSPERGGTSRRGSRASRDGVLAAQSRSPAP